jgi:DNA-directed RNA polymerase subunit RPC12/RpoP
MEETKSKFVTCPYCGKRAIRHTIKEKDYYLCPYCGKHGKVVEPQPIGDPRIDDESLGDPEPETDTNPDVSDSPFME